MHIAPDLSIAGALVGFLIGLTGMGGGALMTPILIMFFGVAPLAAVSSDLVASLFMKPVGAAVHWRRGTVHRRLALWLIVSSVPAAFGGVLLIRALGGSHVQSTVKVLLGVVLLLTIASMLVRNRLTRHVPVVAVSQVKVRPLVTVAIGVFGGLAVGMTSVGSGTLVIALLLLAYPQLRAGQLVGTDLVQAIPLVGAAALGHALFGDVKISVTLSLLVGAIPGVYLGARLSAGRAVGWVRPILTVVLLASAVKLVGAPTPLTLTVAGIWVVLQIGAALAPRISRRLAIRRILRRAAAETPSRTPDAVG
ncbi:MAG: sulfite exporter TauE/SafE family protein [Acidothermus cellulolyticus]|nr:sulfite exporter TauE/SafE family protein [Acidothermus cellulolyticus]